MLEHAKRVTFGQSEPNVLIGVRISDRQAAGQVFVPMHFREAAANLLTNPALDPYAKIEEIKVCAVQVEKAKLEAGLESAVS